MAPATLKKLVGQKRPEFAGTWANFGVSYQGFTGEVIPPELAEGQKLDQAAQFGLKRCEIWDQE